MRVGFLLFPFSPADQDRIAAAGPVAVADVPFAEAPAGGAPYPQAMRIGFALAGAPPQVRPLVPGELRFIPDPAAPGVAPEPADVQFTAAAYAGWRTRGALRITIDTDAARELAKLLPRLEVLPTKLRYGPVQITQEFLFTTLRTGLRKEPLAGVKTDAPAWERHAVALFLAGKYVPILRAGAEAKDDDRIAHPMPTLGPAGPNNELTLTVTAAASQTPRDATRARLDALSAAIDKDDPAHVANGAIPARHLHRLLGAHLTDAAAGRPVPDAVLETDGSTPVYHAIRFTRTWQPVPDCSVHFPRQRIVVSDAAGNRLAAQRLPAHGVLYWSYPADQPALAIALRVEGGMRWIDGSRATVWREPAGTAPLALDLAVRPSPNVQLRLPMSRAMLEEPRATPGEDRCTYLSMRRSFRALVDNRICGGRLSFGVARTGPGTEALMNAAAPGMAAVVRNNRPLPNADAAVGAPALIPVMNAFFPDIVPAQLIGGSRDRTRDFRGGEMAYRLWQTLIDDLNAESTKRNFPPEHVGRGGPGALVALGLADYHLDPVRNAGEADDAYFDRIVGAMLAGVQPGALLQFWHVDADFEGIKATQTAVAQHVMAAYGHSPVFIGYAPPGGAPTAVRVIDQHPPDDCDVLGAAGQRRIEWHGARQAIWLAANWRE